jgi:spermidine/putrescine transport system permease protein
MKHTLRSVVRNNMPFACGSLALVWQALFFYVPLICVIWTSFSGESLLAGFEPFLSWVYVTIIARSIAMALITAVICLGIGYPFAYFLAFRAGALRNVLLFFVMLPFWINLLLHISAWLLVLDRQGVISTALQWLGLLSQPLMIMNSYWAIGIVMVYFYLPFMILPLYAALDRFDKRLLEASSDLGATWTQTVLYVLLPLTMSGIRVGVLLVTIPTFGEFIIPEIMGGDRTMFVGSVITHFILATESAVAGAAFTLISSAVLVLVAGALYIFLGFWCPREQYLVPADGETVQEGQ